MSVSQTPTQIAESLIGNTTRGSAAANQAAANEIGCNPRQLKGAKGNERARDRR